MTKNIISTLLVMLFMLPATGSFAQTKKASQKDIDDNILIEYFAKNKMHPVRTASGLYYLITKKSNGTNPKPGQKVTVNYTGKTMDGKPFDSNIDPAFHHTDPLDFTLGIRQVIAGWDEGIGLLKKGEKGVLYIPSGLAYGKEGRGAVIPPNAILVFDVELLDFN